MAGDKRMGFSNEDVLCMLMPDRFANGNPKNDAFKTMRDKTCDRTARACVTAATFEGIRQHLDYFTDLGGRHCGLRRFLRTTVRAMA